MHIEKFIKYLPKVQNVTLPAREAHLKMANSTRLSFYQNLDLDSLQPKNSAVLMLFYPKNSETHLALILRTPHKGVHSSQIAFPGGKVEKEDVDLQATALRETHEEIGVDSKKINIICPFSKVYIPPSNFMVYPFLGVCEQELNFVLQEDEVAGIVEFPMNDFLDDKNLTTSILNTSYAQNLEVPGFKVKEHFVWGATAMMMSELKDVLKSVL